MDRKNHEPRAAMNFWEKPLSELNGVEWEQLCDGCGRCCLKKLTDEGSDKTFYTRIVCRYFEETSNRCGCYKDRTQLVPECLDVKKMDMSTIDWMPDTCAYRLRFEGKPLYDWHPLIAGSREKMQEISISGKVIAEQHVHPAGYEEHIIRWVKS